MLRWVRLVVGIALGLGILGPLLLLFAFLGFGGARFGWVTAPIAFMALGLFISWSSISVHWARARRVTATVLVMVGLVVGLVAVLEAPATAGRLRHQIELLEQSGWHLEGDRVHGSSVCWGTCTSVTRTYRAVHGLDTVRSTLRPVLRNCERLLNPEREQWRCRGRKITIWLDLVPAAGGTRIYLTAEAR